MELPKLTPATVEEAYTWITDGFREDADFTKTLREEMRDYDPALANYLKDHITDCGAIIIYNRLTDACDGVLPALTEEVLRGVDELFLNTYDAKDFVLQDKLDETDPAINPYLSALKMIFPKVFDQYVEGVVVLKMHTALAHAAKLPDLSEPNN